ncbi:MAG: serine hydrolase domain-containing protein [Myxococcota bacterium]|nr:serine hydrolase domain-containing protein [Myxococcota bacterium]
MEIHGRFDERFRPVHDAFAANFERGAELGASVCVTLDGDPVVDLWAGAAAPGGAAWAEDTIVNVYSTTKTMAALCVLMLADRGKLDLSAPVAEYWPEFAENGKQGVLVRHVMSHSAGVAGFDPPIRPEQLYDWDAVATQLAGQAPWWEPGSVSGYHAITQGFLQGELVRRVTGQSLGTFFRENVSAPLGADFHIGLAAEHDGRVGELVPPEALPANQPESPGEVAIRTFNSCELTGTEPRTRAWRAAEIPAAGGIGNARSVGRIHSAIACGGAVDGVTLLSPEGVEVILEEQTSGQDLVLGVPMRFGMGFGLKSEAMPLGPNERVCFWGGWGGSLAWIDLDARLTVSYVMNHMESDLLGDLRGGSLALASYACLEN